LHRDWAESPPDLTTWGSFFGTFGCIEWYPIRSDHCLNEGLIEVLLEVRYESLSGDWQTIGSIGDADGGLRRERGRFL
jgi:hypothetical protein